eukprot:1194195-Alexandrium_andersonii.AAC.1
MRAGQETKRRNKTAEREARAAVYEGHDCRGAHQPVVCSIMASRRGPKGPLSPLPCVWWCANCHAGAHSAKNLFGTKCKAAGETREG